MAWSINKFFLSKKSQVTLLCLVIAFIAIRSSPIFFMMAPSALSRYLPLHTLMEIFSIVVSVLTFAIAWENQSQRNYINSLAVAIIFLAVAIIDFGHILSYPGMPDFISPSSGSKSIFFWLCGRLFVALGMLYLATSTPRFVASRSFKYLFLLSSFAIVAAVFFFGTNHLEVLPHT